MVGLKVNKKALIAAAKAKKPDKENVTFRLDNKLYGKFQDACENDGVKASAIIEEFMREFVKSK